MSVGLVGVAMSLFLGILLGGISGYFGGADRHRHPARHRVPALGADDPALDGPGRRRSRSTGRRSGLFRHHAHPLADRLDRAWRARCAAGSCRCATRTSSSRRGSTACGEIGIIFRHMVPSFLSHIIASVTLAIPAMILAETSLSFLGIGLRPPVVSWGVLLQEAQNIRAVATAPWLLRPRRGRRASPCSRSTSLATACATPPTPMRS